MTLNHDQYDVREGLKSATGHMAWEWDGAQFITAPLGAQISRLLIEDIQALDGRVSRQPQADGQTRLVMDFTDAQDFVHSAEQDRPHQRGTDGGDAHLTYLRTSFPDLVWQAAEGGYVATGYLPSHRASVVEPFLKHGVRPRDVDVRSHSDAPSFGLFFSDSQVHQLTEHAPGVQR